MKATLSFQKRIANFILLIAITLAALLPTGLRAEVITIGSGTSTTYNAPVNNYYNYTYTQILYTSDELQAGTISSIGFQYSYSTATTYKTNVKIYMGTTSTTSFSSTSSYITSGLTQVYSGNLNCSSGWNTFNLQTPYNYSGTGSLLVVIVDNSGDYDGNSYTFYATSVSNKVITYYSDTHSPSGTLPNTSMSSSLLSVRPNTRFNITSSGGGGGSSDCVEIGSSTNTSSFPMPGLWGWQYNVYLYTPSDASFLSDNCTISSLAWNASSTSSSTGGQMTIWVKDVEASYAMNANTTFGTFTSGATQVYNTSSFTNTTGWNTYTFSSPFSHTAGKALLVMVRAVGCSTSGGCSRSTYYSSVSNSHWTKYQDNSDPGTSVTGTVNDQRVNTKFCYASSGGGGGGDEVSECEGFESGSMPAGWTSQGSATWSVGTGDHSTSTGAGTGTYNAKITHGTTGNITYLVSPTMDLSSALSASVSFSYVNRSWSGDIDYLGVYYRVNGGSWNELFSTTSAHSSWTNQTVNLAGLAANYQIGFKYTDNYGYGVGIDNVCVTYETAGEHDPVTITATSAGNGTVSGSGTVDYNSSVTLTATPASCYSFVSWTENGTVVSTDATYTFSARSNRTLMANFALSSLTLSASANIITTGQSVILSTNCAPTNLYTNAPYVWDWNSNSYTTSGNQPTHIGSPVVAGSTIRFTTAGTDPSIDMYNVGTFNPSIYKTFRMRYRITSGTGGNVEVFFVSTNGSNTSGATGGYMQSTSLISDGQWHIAEVNMSAHASWVSNGNVKGWRLDPCTASGVTMEIDWVGLFPDPIAQNVTSNTQTPAATTTYTACSYSASMLKAPTAQTTVTVIAPPASIPYTCNFENTSENNNWSFENGSATNKWHIGSASQNGGSYGLYISNDGGSSNAYTITASAYVYAYRTINFTETGYYIIDFDWKAQGESSNYDYMRAYLVPESTAITAGTTLSQPSFSGTLNQQSTWQHSTTTVTISSAGIYKLVFSWFDDTSGGTQPPASVDNVSIIPTPTHVTIIPTTVGNGSVSGGGNVPYNTTATVTATPNACYNFVNWTENGTVVSTDASYSFTAAENRTLVANFEELPWQPTLVSDPTATTCLAQGTPVTLTADITGGGNSLADYTFATGTNGTSYSPSWTTMISSGTDDGASSLSNIGFTFTYDGVEYTQFSVNSNGNLRLGSTLISSSYYSTPFGSSYYNYNEPKIIGTGRDMSTGSAGYVRTGLSGSSGSYVRVIEFMLNTGSLSTGTTYVKYQVQLFQANNEVRIVYSGDYSNAPSGYQIGLGNASYNKFWYVNPSNHTASYSTTYSSTIYSVWPGANRYYSFTPSTPSTYTWSHSGTAGIASDNTYNVTPTQSANRYTVSVTIDGCTKSTYQSVTVQDPTPTGLTFTNVYPHSATASWDQGNATSWQYSYDGGNTWTTTSSNTVNLTGLTPDTYYTFQVRTTGTSCPSEPVSGAFTTTCTARNLTWNGGGSTLNLQPFETTQVSASVSVGGGTITYSSDDGTIATIDVDGIVTALHPGTTTLYAEVPAADPYCSMIIPRSITVTACPEITLGSGNGTNAYLPSYYNSSYSLSEQLYSPCEIGKAGTISSIALYNSNSSNTTNRNFDIYLVHSDKGAFTSTSDWIHPTATDKVFSGTVSFGPSGWTTIYLDQPFEYDGTHYLAMIMDNNLGASATSANFRTYTTEESQYQALTIDGSTNYYPTSITSAGVRRQAKNQVKFGMCNQSDASATFTVAVTASPAVGGTISGTGSYSMCSDVTLTATPDPCYRFVKWTENGEDLPANASSTAITFKATTNRNLVAVFEEWGVNVTANGQSSNITVDRGTEVTLSATTSPQPPVTPTYTWTVAEGTEGTANNNTYTVIPEAITNTYTMTAEVNGCRKSATRTINTTCPVPTNLQVTYTANGADITWDGDADGYNVQYGVPGGTYTETIFADDFENGLANWTTIINGESHVSGYTNWQQFDVSSVAEDWGVSPHSGSYAARSRSWSQSAYDVDNWLITPRIRLDGTLKFYAADDGQYHEHYDVYVSTNGNSMSDFTLLYSPGYANSSWAEVIVDLSSFQGAMGYIALRHTDYDQDYLLIDDFSITRQIEISETTSEPEHVTGNTYSLTCLVPDATYTVQVQADCGIDQSAWSEIAVPGTPDNGGEVTIGDGTSTISYLPTYEFYNYSLTQQIYAASEINNSGAITSLSFYVSSTYSSTRTLDLYMKHTSKSAFSSGTDWESISASDLVYRGTVSYNSEGWVTLNLSTPFNYDGTSNLLICVDDNTGGYATSNAKYVHDAPSAAIWVCSDGTNHNPFTASNYTGNVLNVKNNIKLTFNVPATSSSPGGMIASNPTTTVTGAEEEITIGEGTSAGSISPFYTLYDMSFVEQIYPADEIGTAGTINSVSFHYSNANTSENKTYSIVMYMKNTTRSSFSSTSDYEPVTAADIVYSGNFTVTTTNNVWITIPLDRPFEYDGTSNLMIAIDENTDDDWTSKNFYYTEASNSVVYFYSDSYNADPYDLGSYSGSASTSSYRANIKLSIAPTSNSASYTEVCQSETEPIVIQSIIGVSNGHYKWHRNGTEISNSDTDTYIITSSELQSLEPGTYTYTRYAYNVCTENWELSDGEFSINLLAASTAEVTVAGNEEDIICGTEAQLYVTEPDPMHIHHWYADEYCTQYIASGNELNFPALYENTTVYRVTEVLQNPCPLAAESYTLNVTPQPVPEVANEEVEAICGLPVTLSLDANSYDSRFGYEWSAYSDFREIITPNDPEGRSITVTQPTGDYTYYVRSYKRREAPTQLVYNFDWTEEVETFPVPEGTSALRLEVWGGEGGLSLGNGTIQGYGGKGGYSVGTLENPTARNLYVAVGGKGSDAVRGNGTITITAPGGWNGGGGGTCDDDASSDSGREASGAGGGATHIATANGVLASLDNNREAVLIVAGGGGGASWSKAGGYGGGLTPGAGAGSGNKILGTFGQGANAQGMGSDDGVGGGGGGWLGGNAYDCGNCGGSNAGGGSGYVNSTLLSNAATINGDLSIEEPNGEVHIGHSGNGYARITILGFTPAGCESAPAEVHLTVNAAEEFTYTPTTSICGENVTITLDNTLEGYSYDWYEIEGEEPVNAGLSNTLENLTDDAAFTINYYPADNMQLEACHYTKTVTVTLKPIVDPVVAISGYAQDEANDIYYCGTPVTFTVTNDTADMANFNYVWFSDENCTQTLNGGISEDQLTIDGLNNLDGRTVYVKACRMNNVTFDPQTATCVSNATPATISIAPIDPMVSAYYFDMNTFEMATTVNICENGTVTLVGNNEYTGVLGDALDNGYIENKVVWYRTDGNGDSTLVRVTEDEEGLDVTETEPGTYYYYAFAVGHATADAVTHGNIAKGMNEDEATRGTALAFNVTSPSYTIFIDTLDVYPYDDNNATNVTVRFAPSANADPMSEEGWTTVGNYQISKDGDNAVALIFGQPIEIPANSTYTIFLDADRDLYYNIHTDENYVRGSDPNTGATLLTGKAWGFSGNCQQGFPIPTCASSMDKMEFVGNIHITMMGGNFCLSENFAVDTVIVHPQPSTPSLTVTNNRFFVCHGDDPVTLVANAETPGDDITYVWTMGGEGYAITTENSIEVPIPTDDETEQVVYGVSILSLTCGQTDESTVILYISVVPEVADIHTDTLCAPADINLLKPEVVGEEYLEATGWQYADSEDSETWTNLEMNDENKVIVTTELSGKFFRYFASSPCNTGYSNVVALVIDSIPYYDENALKTPDPICAGAAFDWEANSATPNHINNSGRETRSGYNLYANGELVNLNADFQFEFQGLNSDYYQYNCYYVSRCGETWDSIWSNTVTITVWDIPTIDNDIIIGNDPVCANNPISIAAPNFTPYGEVIAHGWEYADLPGARHYTRLSDGVDIMDDEVIIGYDMNGKFIRYYVETQCGISTSNSVQLAVTNAAQLAGVTTPDAICDGTPFTLEAPEITDNGGLDIISANWYVIIGEDAPVTVRANAIITEEWNGARLFYSVENNCGTTTTDTLTLTVHPAIGLTAYASLDGDTELEGNGCFGPDYYLVAQTNDMTNVEFTWSNQETGSNVVLTRPEAGTYEYTVTAEMGSGCTATATVNFTVNEVITNEITVNMCNGELPYVFDSERNDATFDNGGDYELTYQTAEGCDSIVTLHLNVYRATIQHTNVHLCGGESYTWDVNSQVYGGAGMADTVLTDTVIIASTSWISDLGNNEPCDSIIHTLRVTISDGLFIDIPNDDFTVNVGEEVSAVANVRMGCQPTAAKTIMSYQLYKDGEPVDNANRYGSLNFTTYLPQQNSNFSTDIAEGTGNIPGTTFNVYNYAFNYFYANFFDEIENHITATWNEPGEYEIKFVVAEMTNGQDFPMTYPTDVNGTATQIPMGGAGSTPTGLTLTDTASIVFHVDGEATEEEEEPETAGTYKGHLDIDTTVFTQDIAATSEFTLSIIPDAANDPTKLAIDYEIYRNDEMVATGAYGTVHFQTELQRVHQWFGADLTSATGSIPANTFTVVYHNYDFFYNHFMESAQHQFTAVWNQPGEYKVKFILRERTEGQDIPLPYTANADLLIGGHGSSNGAIVASDSVIFVVKGETVTLELDETICEANLPFEYNGLTFTESTTDPVNIPDVNGVYDTLLTVNLTVIAPDTVRLEETVCDSYEWNEEVFTESGIYTKNFENAYGCDSVVILNLTVIGQPEVTISAAFNTVCAGTDVPVTATLTYLAGENTSNATEVSFPSDETSRDTSTTGIVTVVYERTLYELAATTQLTAQSISTANGVTCTAVDTIEITVLPTDSIVSFTASVCQGEAFDRNEEWDEVFAFGISGERTQAAIAADNRIPTEMRDTIITGQNSCGIYKAELILTVNPSFTSENPLVVEDVVCENYDYNGNFGFNFTVDEIAYQLSIATSNIIIARSENESSTGCDSITELRLTVLPSARSEAYDTVCGVFYDLQQNEITESGDVDFVYPNAAVSGCDSIVTHHVTVYQPVVTEVYEIVCDAYYWNDEELTVSDDYTHVFTAGAATGCDSTVILHLTVKHSTHEIITEAACDSFAWNNVTYYTSGTYTYEYENEEGCPSADTLYLTINNASRIEENREIALAELPYEWNGVTFTAPGTQEVTHTSSTDCDSVVVMTLTIEGMDNSGDQPTIAVVMNEAGDTATFRVFANQADPSEKYSINYTLTKNEQNVNDMDYDCGGRLYIGTEMGEFIYGEELNAITGNVPQNTFHIANYHYDYFYLNFMNGRANIVTNNFTEPGTYTVTFEMVKESDGQDFPIPFDEDLTHLIGGKNSTPSTDVVATAIVTFTITDDGQGGSSASGPVLVLQQNGQAVETVTDLSTPVRMTVDANGYTSNDQLAINYTILDENDEPLPMLTNIGTVNVKTAWNGQLYGQNLAEAAGSIPNASFCPIITYRYKYFYLDFLTFDNTYSEITANWTMPGTYKIKLELVQMSNGQDFPLTFGTNGQHIGGKNAVATGVTFDTKTLTYNGSSQAANPAATGIADNEGMEEISIYPNPTQSTVNVKLNLDGSEDAELHVYDMYGKHLQTVNVSGNVTEIDLSTYAGGVYMVKVVRNGEVTAIAKVVKQR